MRRFTMLTICLVVVACFTATTAFAQNPHFVSASASIQSNGDLTISFKEAGLGAGQTITYDASATSVSATYGCVNGGGKHPEATNKETVSGPSTATGSFTAAKNGSISQSLTLTPPPAGSSFSCSPGQKLEVGTVSYSNVTITDTTNTISEVVGTGTFSVTVNNF